MGTQMILNEQSIVCRTCLKVLDHVSNTGFTYLDDETSYVKDVGSIREMLQFCIPELDLYVSARPLVCYSCLTILVQVYNFKIKCLSGENIIKDYISRNNLQEYNQVNLNCVLIDDLKMKSQKILSTQIENKIKLLMSEVPDKTESPNLQSSAVVPATIQQTAPMMIITPISVNNSQPKKEVHEEEEEEEEEMDETSGETNLTETNETVVEVSEAAVEEAVAVEEEIEKPVKMEVSEPDESMDGDSQDLFDDEDSEDDSADESDDTSQDPTTNPPPPPAETKEESHINTVAVRKDLFDSSQPPPQLIVKEIPKEAPSVILNEGMVAQNGRIVIKIDRKKLQTYKGAEKHQNKEQTKTVISLVEAPSSCSMPKIVSVSSVEESESSDQQQEQETEQEYKCNKCSYETKDVIEMYDHNRRFHSFDYTCQHCPFSTSKVELLGKHMSMVHPQTLTPQKTTINFKVTENYACSLCPFSVKSLDLLRSHHMSAHGRSDGPIILNSAFSESGLRATPRILKRLEYTCDVCPYTTKDKSNLRKHLFTHGTKPLTCDNCSYKCVSPYQLRRHQKQKHGREADPRARNQPYPLPDFKKEKQEALDNFKITLETIKREIEKEMAQSS